MASRIVTWSPRARNARVEAFLKRPAFDRRAEAVARQALDQIRLQGEPAVAACVRKYDGITLPPAAWRVGADELRAAARQVTATDRAAIREAHRRIATFARAGMKRNWFMASPRGGRLGERFVPFERVGAYIPGGQVPLVSTALMTVTLAHVAGVPEIVACTPGDRDGKLNPMLLHALHVAGATEIYRIGGIQAIGLMAYGTRRVAHVQKIVGPGGTFVTAAKRLVYGDVALDLVAGPSEIAVLSDGSVPARCVAGDLISQAEHGTGWEKALLVTTSAAHARDVAAAMEHQLTTLPRADAVRRVVAAGGILLVVVRSLADGADLCNRFAPEHLELMVRKPTALLKAIRCAGAVFLGAWTPESAGDFVAGPSHVLPTGGAAAMFSGLTVDDFLRRSSIIAFSRADLWDTLPVIEAFGRMERLEGHARSARLRFETD
ncbi:MAG: histidinol dehydrogenase [Lentisphaerae bacterium]|nr:histidinol dehydrogenase [Lentisphaerota bacterium]